MFTVKFGFMEAGRVSQVTGDKDSVNSLVAMLTSLWRKEGVTEDRFLRVYQNDGGELRDGGIIPALGACNYEELRKV